MKMYLLQNIFGFLRSITEISLLILEGRYEGEIIDEEEKGVKIVKNKAFVIIRNILDMFVATYYINRPAGKASRIGVVGVITSLIGIYQSLRPI
jgi:hypothetical protein